MIDPEDYRIAWQLYLAAGIAASAIWYFLLRAIPLRFVRYWLLLAALAFFFVPTRHPDVESLMWVPASVTAGMGLVSEGLEKTVPTLIICGAAQFIALILAILCFVIIKKPAKPSRTEKAAPTVG